MTPDLDQNLSLKASMLDKVTPVLNKIQKGVKQTREAFSEMVSNTKQTGEGVGQATGDMETKVVQDLSKIQDGLKTTSGAFEDFSGTATSSSGKVGKAIKDAAYTKGAEDRLSDLDKDLGKLDKTFKGMASRQGSISGKARSLAATSSDNINKKVIPAFQELHGTLDDYPDVLEDINRLEQDRMRILEDNQGAFSRMAGRVSEAGEGLKAASEELKYGLRDMAALVNAGILGTTGTRVQEMQTGAAQIAGAEAFAQTPEMLKRATEVAHTTMEVIEPFAMTMLELQSVSADTMPDLIAQFVNLSKVTGDSGDEIVALHDQLTNLAGIKGEGFLDIQDNMKYFQETSRATWDDMSAVIQGASSSMLAFSEDSRRAYAKSALAAGAAAKNMGLAATTPAQVIETLLDDPNAMSKMQGLITNSGQNIDIQALIADPEKQAEAFDAMIIAIKSQFGEMNMMNAVERKAVMAMTAGLGFNKDELLRVFEGKRMTGEGEGGTAAEMAAQAVEEAPGTIMESAVVIRKTVTEQFEQTMGLMQSGLIEPGRKLAEGVANAAEIFNEKVLSSALVLERVLDAEARARGLPTPSTILAVAGMEEVLATGMKSLGKAGAATGMVPEGITDMMQGSGWVDKLIIGIGGAIVGHKLIAGEGLEGPKFFETPRETMENVISSPEAMAKAQGAITASGQSVDLQALIREGHDAEAFAAITAAIKEQFGGLNPQDAVQRKAMKEMGILPERGAGLGLTSEEQMKIFEGAKPSKTARVMSMTPLAPLAQAGKTLGAVPDLVGKKVELHMQVFNALKEGIGEIHGMYSAYQDLLDTFKTYKEDMSNLSEIEIKDKQGEKRAEIQERMLAELKIIAEQLKPSAQGTSVKSAYTPGVDRSREYMELDKGYS
jgi:hypothetical protein